MLAIVDLGLGNLRSVEKAVALASGVTPLVTNDPDAIARAEKVVVPGQGAFRDGAAALARDGGAIAEALRASIKSAKPYLGICLGLQLLMDDSEEAPGAHGLGVFSGSVRKIPDDLLEGDRKLKVPHMGWNKLHSATLPNEYFYFVHSYHAIPDDPTIVAATVSYGCLEITAALARGTLLATQFHPEKSQRAGLSLLETFLRRRD
jgi:imidazole glycerol-phosphate synthase subunit HisH